MTNLDGAVRDLPDAPVRNVRSGIVEPAEAATVSLTRAFRQAAVKGRFEQIVILGISVLAH